jgi:hypothetical protein
MSRRIFISKKSYTFECITLKSDYSTNVILRINEHTAAQCRGNPYTSR